MVPADLMRLVLERSFSTPEARKSAAQAVIKRLAYVAPATAIDLLDGLPEADEHGMQVYTPCAKSLHSQGMAHGEGSPGSPKTFSRRHFATVDDTLATGEWDSGPGRHTIKFDFDEWVHVLEGEAHVTVQGRTRVIRAGDVALFRAGLSMTWDVPKYIRKVWVHRYPQCSLLTRVGNFVRRRIARAAAIIPGKVIQLSAQFGSASRHARRKALEPAGYGAAPSYGREAIALHALDVELGELGVRVRVLAALRQVAAHVSRIVRRPRAPTSSPLISVQSSKIARRRCGLGRLSSHQMRSSSRRRPSSFCASSRARAASLSSSRSPCVSRMNHARSASHARGVNFIEPSTRTSAFVSSTVTGFLGGSAGPCGSTRMARSANSTPPSGWIVALNALPS